MRTAGIVAIVVLSAFLVACGTNAPTVPVATPNGTSNVAPAGAGPVGASLKEWTIGLTAPSAKAGSVQFSVRNEGTVPHDLVIVKTDLPANRLPTAGGKVDESQVTVVGRTGQLTPGEGTSVSADLAAGAYVLFCSVIGHYNSGQYAAFAVP